MSKLEFGDFKLNADLEFLQDQIKDPKLNFMMENLIRRAWYLGTLSTLTEVDFWLSHKKKFLAEIKNHQNEGDSSVN
jgi:hypothetical protein